MDNGPALARWTGVGAALGDRHLRWVNLLLGGAVLAGLSVVVLRQWEEWFAAASEIGTVALDLGVAYLAGWIFYYLTIWRPHEVAQSHVGRYVARAAATMAGQASGYLGHLCHAAGRPSQSAITRSELLALLAGLSPSDPANMIDLSGRQLTLADAAADGARRIDQASRRVEGLAAFVDDAELLRCVYAVVDATFLRVARDRTLSLPARGFGGLGESIVGWFERSDELRLWLSANFAAATREAGLDPESVANARALLPD